MRRSRRGISLLEVLAVVTFGSILLGLGARTLVALIRLDRSGRERLADDASTALLTRDFRADVHAARSARPSGPAGDAVDLEISPGRSVRYAIDGGRLARVDTKAGRRSYRLPGRSTPRFEVDARGRPTLVRLRIVPDEGSASTSPFRGFAVEARLDLDGRFRAERRGDDAGPK